MADLVDYSEMKSCKLVAPQVERLILGFLVVGSIKDQEVMHLVNAACTACRAATAFQYVAF